MSHWRDIHRPELHWAPSGLPGWMRRLPGWAARGVSESRLPVEAVSLLASPVLRDPTLPRGDGAPVLVVPGFGFGDASVLPLHAVLRRFGYRTLRSGIVSNIDCSDTTVDALARVAAAEVTRTGQRLQVVGQSRGGMLARGLGARRPDLVARAVNLGGPLNDEFAFYEIPQPFVVATRTAHHAVNSELRERGCGTPSCSCPYMRAVHSPMPEKVRVVSVYSREDGIVDWRACLLPGAENVEVRGSHLGMGFNPEVLRVIADALAAG